MTADETMTINERRKYLTKMQTRYQIADRQERGQLLTEMEAITGAAGPRIVGLALGIKPVTSHAVAGVVIRWGIRVWWRIASAVICRNGRRTREELCCGNKRQQSSECRNHLASRDQVHRYSPPNEKGDTADAQDRDIYFFGILHAKSSSSYGQSHAFV